MKLCTLALSFSFVTLLQAQVAPAAGQELEHVFDRPAGKLIEQEQKDKLAAWLQQHEGKDLGAFGYAVALKYYLDRDYPKAVAALDEFCKKGLPIASAEHRTMAGRIFLNAAVTEGRAEAPDMDKLSRWGEGMVRLYDDTSMLERMAKTISARVPDPAAFRVALARGVFASGLPVAQQDSFLKNLYAEAAAVASEPRVGAMPATPLRALPAAAPVDQSKVVQVGQVLENFAVDRVVHGPSGFDLASCKGKVVVLDFFASWCDPCRAAVPGMVQLQKDHPDDVQVMGVTRYYGHGMDFSGADAKPPHGGATVKDLDHDQEGALYAPLVERFGINYPIVFSTDQDLARERFGVTGIPTMFVIGRDGKLAGKVVGDGEPQHTELLRLVEQARH
ncbi:MAG: TlpA disulfide reductase family protein [Planctomycetota bacterium]